MVRVKALELVIRSGRANSPRLPRATHFSKHAWPLESWMSMPRAPMRWPWLQQNNTMLKCRRMTTTIRWVRDRLAMAALGIIIITPVLIEKWLWFLKYSWYFIKWKTSPKTYILIINHLLAKIIIKNMTKQSGSVQKYIKEFYLKQACKIKGNRKFISIYSFFT